MKRLIFFIVILVLLINLLPFLILQIVQKDEIKLKINPQKTVRVWMEKEHVVKTIPLEEYIVGVVAAEMPASFSEDALKAQAISARTYTINKIQIARDVVDNPHPNADVCNSPLHCQAWISVKEQNARWGLLKALYYREKIQSAVEATKGLVITYQNKLIDPVYHSTCAGHTEDASEVWQYDAPYLKGVSCNYDKASPKYSSIVKVSLKNIDRIFGTKISRQSAFRSFFSSPINITARTNGGRVRSIKIGDKEFSGVEVRAKLNLNSAKFNIKASKNEIIFYVQGYGHGVGMCQFGAGGMASQGKSYEDILHYYYSDIKIVKVY